MPDDAFDIRSLILAKHADDRRAAREFPPIGLDLAGGGGSDLWLSHDHLRRGESMSVSASPSRLKESISEATTIVGAKSSSG